MAFSYQDGWFPFQIPELAEDGAPFEVWDGSTLYGRYDVDLTSGDYPDDGYGNSQSTSGYSYSGKPSKSSSGFVTTVGPGSPYPLGPFTLEQLSELYWRVRAWNFSVAPVSPISSGPVSIGSSVSGTLEQVRWDGIATSATTPFDLVLSNHFPYQKFHAAVTGYVASNYDETDPPADIYSVNFSVNPPDDQVGENTVIAEAWAGGLLTTPVQYGDRWGYQYSPFVAQKITESGTTRTQYWAGTNSLFSAIALGASHTHDASPPIYATSGSNMIYLSGILSSPRTWENWTRSTSVQGSTSSETHVSEIQRNSVTIVLNSGTIVASLDSQFSGTLPLPLLSITMTASTWHDYEGLYNPATGAPV